ncbi:Protein ALP1-like [Nymphon striatum]|nr:Protein ALP1-like [Nymphon striatum]
MATSNTISDVHSNEDVVMLRRLAITRFLIQNHYAEESENGNERRWWVRPIFERREEQGAYHNLVREMRLNDNEYYFKFHRMSPTQFDEILSLVGPIIQKQDTHFRSSISAGERLSMTLRYLASGNSQASISFAYRCGRSTVSTIIRETNQAIWDALQGQYLRKPNAEEWQSIAKLFDDRWNFPNCIGAIDGKHVTIQAPPCSGSDYFNYKGHFSVVLMATCDAKYSFTMVDIGSNGRGSDGAVFAESSLSDSTNLDLPPPCRVPGSEKDFPFVFVGDEAFPLKENLLRPYPGRSLNHDRQIYNYRLSRARRVIENAFGFLASRWRIYRQSINGDFNTVVGIIKSTVCLHNFLMSRTNQQYCSRNYADWEDHNGIVHPGLWRTETGGGNGAMRQTQRTGSNMYSQNASQIRENFNEYFVD